MRREALVIAGAGPAGCAAAIALGDARPLVLERQRETGDALCGGFLSWETLERLETLGVRGLEAHPIARLRLFAGQRRAEARLPSLGLGVSRQRLDTIMQRVAEERGARIEYGVTIRETAGTTLATDGEDLEADALFLATGKHDLRGLARPREGGDPTLGLRVRIPAHPGLRALIANAIELHLFDRGYAGLLLQEDGSANLCMAVRKSRLAETGGKPEALLAAIAGGTPLADRLAYLSGAPVFDAIGAVPYGWRATTTEPGVFRLGDQAAVIPSLAGEGIGIALASGMAAARDWRGGRNAEQFQRRFAGRTRRPVAFARIAWSLAERPLVGRAATALIDRLPMLARLIARATRIGD